MQIQWSLVNEFFLFHMENIMLKSKFNIQIEDIRISIENRYHNWMQNEEIRELTASLPLSIEEEYQMQQTWLNDQDKITFIILSRDKFERTKNEIGENDILQNLKQENSFFVLHV